MKFATLTKFSTICEVESNIGVNSATLDQPGDYCNPFRIESKTLQAREWWKTWNWARYSIEMEKLAGELLRTALVDGTTIEGGPG